MFSYKEKYAHPKTKNHPKTKSKINLHFWYRNQQMFKNFDIQKFLTFLKL